ncbi:MAG: SPOR domain-containing protein [Pseudomonadales bacterium]|nr:SPOR domain-containing protein [Pseudomonadales bacterium]
MAHDFAKKGKTRQKKKNSAKNQATPWRNFAAGLVVGVILGPLLYLAIVADRPDTPVAQAAQPDTKEQSSDKTAKNPTTSLKKLKNQIEFTFYDKLPKQQTKIDLSPEPARDSKSSTQRYMLQAGSFRKLSDADQLRADLIMKGLSNTKINSVTRSGSTWHRVQIGPFDSKRVMNQARNILSRNGTDSLVLSIKK